MSGCDPRRGGDVGAIIVPGNGDRGGRLEKIVHDAQRLAQL
ncbi:MAG: hypothetical protein K0R17_4059, partial [Rariglobus sp.]|nr:hypothetical protein [Rariglobus sp.]